MAALKCVTCGTPLHRLEPTIYGCETSTCKLVPAWDVELNWKASLPRAEFIKRGCYRLGRKEFRRAKRVAVGTEAALPDMIATDADGMAYLYQPREDWDGLPVPAKGRCMKWPWGKLILSVQEMATVKEHATIWNAALAKAADIVRHAPLRESGLPRLRELLAQKIESLRRPT